MTIHVKIKRFCCDFCTYEASLKLYDQEVQIADCKEGAFDKPENVGELNDSIERKLKNSDLSTLPESFGQKRESEKMPFCQTFKNPDDTRNEDPRSFHKKNVKRNSDKTLTGRPIYLILPIQGMV